MKKYGTAWSRVGNRFTLGNGLTLTRHWKQQKSLRKREKKALERLMLHDGKIHVTGFTLTKEGLEIEGYFIGDQGGETP